jgi:hypothetical protein
MRSWWKKLLRWRRRAVAEPSPPVMAAITYYPSIGELHGYTSSDDA